MFTLSVPWTQPGSVPQDFRAKTQGTSGHYNAARPTPESTLATSATATSPVAPWFLVKQVSTGLGGQTRTQRTFCQTLP